MVLPPRICRLYAGFDLSRVGRVRGGGFAPAGVGGPSDLRPHSGRRSRATPHRSRAWRVTPHTRPVIYILVRISHYGNFPACSRKTSNKTKGIASNARSIRDTVRRHAHTSDAVTRRLTTEMERCTEHRTRAAVRRCGGAAQQGRGVRWGGQPATRSVCAIPLSPDPGPRRNVFGSRAPVETSPSL